MRPRVQLESTQLPPRRACHRRLLVQPRAREEDAPASDEDGDRIEYIPQRVQNIETHNPVARKREVEWHEDAVAQAEESLGKQHRVVAAHRKYAVAKPREQRRFATKRL